MIIMKKIVTYVCRLQDHEHQKKKVCTKWVQQKSSMKGRL